MKKILLIDDDQLFLNFLSDYVRERYPNLEILAFNNALQGLSHIDTDLDLLLLDLEMPGLDGTKLLAFAKERGEFLAFGETGKRGGAATSLCRTRRSSSTRMKRWSCSLPMVE